MIPVIRILRPPPVSFDTMIIDAASQELVMRYSKIALITQRGDVSSWQELTEFVSLKPYLSIVYLDYHGYNACPTSKPSRPSMALYTGMDASRVIT